MELPRSAISLRQLRYFVAVADASSFSSAAERIHVAQPALSRQIAMLEAQVGLPLLNRSRKGVTLTTGGIRLYDLACSTLERLGSIQSELRSSETRPAGVVKIALPPSVASMLVPNVLCELEVHYPEIILRVEDGPSLVKGRSLEDAMLDFGIVPAADELADVDYEPLVLESLLLVQKRSESRRVPATIALDQVARLKLVLPTRNFHTRRVIDEVARAAHLALNIAYEQRSMTTIMSLVRDGLGATITNSPAIAQFWAPGTVSARRIVRPNIMRTISLARSSRRNLSVAAQAVYDVLKRSAMASVRDGRWVGKLLC